MRKYNLSPDMCCYVGNTDDDSQAASEAGITYYDREAFFHSPVACAPDPGIDCPSDGLPSYTWEQNGDSYVGTLPVSSAKQATEFVDHIRRECDLGRKEMPHAVWDGATLVVETEDVDLACWIDFVYRTALPGADIRWDIVYGV
jgi:hypothetical protein